MCVNRSWSYLDGRLSEKPENIIIKARRSDGEYFQYRIDLHDTNNDPNKVIVRFIEGVQAFETFRNCECPKNKECHKIIDGKVNVIIAHNTKETNHE
jgi:hypothetical protein